MLGLYILLYIIGFVSISEENPCVQCGVCSICILNINQSKIYCRGDVYEQIYEPKWPECPFKDHCKINNLCSSPEQCHPSFGSYYCVCGEEYHGRHCEIKSGKSTILFIRYSFYVNFRANNVP